MWRVIFLLWAGSLLAGSAYPYNEHIPKKTWKQLSAFFLPENHPIREQLDLIFSPGKRPIENSKALLAAGFTNSKQQIRSHIIVTRHQLIPGYIFKIYTDNQSYHRGIPEWEMFAGRIRGVNQIAKYIEANGMQHLFKTPKKWLYPIRPTKNVAKKQKFFILVEEEMDLLNTDENLNKWSRLKSPRLLNEIYHLVTAVEFNDGLRPDNLPFCRDGRIAFIDTQKVSKPPVRYEQLIRFLPKELKKYWISLTAQK